MNLHRFQIGDRVAVKAWVEFHTSNGKRSYERMEFETPRTGTIVGAGARYEGNIEREYVDSEGAWGVSGSYNIFVADKRYSVWLVRFGLVCKEVAVLDADLNLFLPTNNKTPIYENPSVWDARVREVLRQDAKNAPRDSHGRFLKKVKETVQHGA